MGSRIQCFMVEATERARQSLRRFVHGDRGKCTGAFGYHNASVVLGDIDYPASEFDGDGKLGHAFKGDTRWPTHCPCGYPFTDADEWQDNRERLYRRPGSDEVFTSRKAPAGAMWRAPWYEKDGECVGPDGQSLIVMLPDGVDWHIDGFASSGGRWTRQGVPPLVTASPSILTSKYHGFLRNGWLEEC
jgi:hypothetical protein